MHEGPDLDDPKWTLVRRWDEPGQRIRMALDAHLRGVVYFRGKGSVAGSKALVDLLEDMQREIGRDKIISALVDMRELDGAPLRAQFIIGKWLFQNKRQVERIAVFGGKPFEMKIAQAVMKIGGMRNAHFCDRIEQAVGWLGWPSELYR